MNTSKCFVCGVISHLGLMRKSRWYFYCDYTIWSSKSDKNKEYHCGGSSFTGQLEVLLIYKWIWSSRKWAPCPSLIDEVWLKLNMKKKIVEFCYSMEVYWYREDCSCKCFWSILSWEFCYSMEVYDTKGIVHKLWEIEDSMVVHCLI